MAHTQETGFELTEHTADIGFRAWAPELPELFKTAACALFSIIAGSSKVAGENERRLEIGGRSHEELLVEWLNILNATHQIRRELYGEFDVTVTENRVSAAVRGEAIDPERHDLRLEVKAVTYHGLTLKKTDAGYETEVLLDI